MNDIKELRKLIKLCREQGVQSIRFDGVELHLGDVPSPIDARKYPDLTARGQAQPLAPGGITDQTAISMPDALSEEDLLFWSTGGQQS